MFSRLSAFTFLSLIPSTIMGLFAFALILVGKIPLFYLLFTFSGWVLFDGLGVAVGYHRVFAHRTHDLPVWKEVILLFLGTMSGQGSSIAWTSIHRGYHHAHADTAKDLHSPIHGKWHAVFGWTLGLTHGSVSMKYASDLLRKKHHLWFHFHGVKVFWLVPALVALLDWKLALAGVCLPSAISFWNESLINLVGHHRLPGSYRNFDTADRSQNHGFFALVDWGHGWHNNHHAKPNSYDFGSGASGKWWEFDPCRLFLPFLGSPKRH